MYLCDVEWLDSEFGGSPQGFLRITES